MRRTETDNLRAVRALEEKMVRARSVLQRTTDQHPDFEKRVQKLVYLSDALDQMLTGFHSPSDAR
jgi:hypothetical protein